MGRGLEQENRGEVINPGACGKTPLR